MRRKNSASPSTTTQRAIDARSAGVTDERAQHLRHPTPERRRVHIPDRARAEQLTPSRHRALKRRQRIRRQHLIEALRAQLRDFDLLERHGSSLLQSALRPGGGDCSGRDDQRPAQSARCIVPAAGGRDLAHARGGGADLRRKATPIRAAAGPRRVAPRPGAALPAARRGGSARPGPPALGRRRALRPALPRAQHRAPGAGQRVRAAGARRPRLLAPPAPRPAAVGDVARGGPRSRPLRDPLQDPPRARRRCLRPRHPQRALRARRGGVRAVAARACALHRRAGDRGAPRARDERRRARTPASRRRATPAQGRQPHRGDRRRRRRAGLGGPATGAADPLQRRPGRARPARSHGRAPRSTTSRRSRTRSAGRSTMSC